METDVQILAIAASSGLLLGVLELVRRRHLLERYALLWLLSTSVLLVLAIWRGLLETIASVIGVSYPPSALFLIAFAFILLLLLHFSASISRLSDQSKVLAQRLAQLEERLRRQEGRSIASGPGGAAADRAAAQAEPAPSASAQPASAAEPSPAAGEAAASEPVLERALRP